MKIPNFFIIGAPKCGTTALSEYLRQHPAIFFSDPKEPHFFNSDFGNRFTTSLDSYLQCFEGASDAHLAVGEGSVLYLSSRVAIPGVLSLQPEARFIVMVRNPVDMAYSWHSQALYAFGEDEYDFERAWRLQEYRRRGEAIPRFCKEPKVLLYGDLCKVGSQLQRLYEVVPPDRVKVVFFEDFVNKTKQSYESVLRFLGVPSDGRMEFPRENSNKRFRSVWLESMLRFGAAAWAQTKESLHLDIRLRLAERVRRLNTAVVERGELPQHFREELNAFFREDVETLSDLTGRDLSHWGLVDQSRRPPPLPGRQQS